MRNYAIKQDTFRKKVAEAFGAEVATEEYMKRLRRALADVGIRPLTIYSVTPFSQGELGPHLSVKAEIGGDSQSWTVRSVLVAQDFTILSSKTQERSSKAITAAPREFRGQGRDPRRSVGDYSGDDR